MAGTAGPRDRDPVPAAGVCRGPHDEDAGAGHDRDVGDIADEPPVVVDEVDHPPYAGAGGAEEPVKQVGRRAAANVATDLPSGPGGVVGQLNVGSFGELPGQ
jgi:hypothetical protein